MAACLIACAGPPSPPAPRSIRITTGPPAGALSAAGEALASAYRAELPDLAPEVLTSLGTVENVEVLERGQVELGFSFANVAYAAFVGQLPGQTAPFPRLRAIALLQRSPVHFLVGPRSEVHRIEDLRGKKASFGYPGSGTALTVELLLRAFGLDPDKIATPTQQLDAEIAGLLAGRVAALFVPGTPPAAPVQAALAGGGRLLPLQGPPIEGLLQEYPFYSAMTIPADAYRGLSTPVLTIGVNAVLLCRADLADDLVYRLTKALYEAPAGRAVDPALAQWLDVSVGAATPIPLHPGAARYYRERELFP
jgi:hypothetical protein